ncbi:hypothetical protein [Janthinobacterium sp. RB2R34]|uniref:hypothetical protein n=1 Tax=Janthinobacterium sp. RB2R34 TaxID=3424193 RepID=UPI003F28FD52
MFVKKLMVGAGLALCMLGAHAAGVTDFIGTWQLASTTVPNRVEFRQEGTQLVAVRQVRNALTNKLVERRYAATYADGAIMVPAAEPKIEATLVAGVPTVTVLGETFQKMSSATAPQASS